MSDDLIRRQDAIDAVKGRFSMPVDNLIVEVIGALPSAQPEPQWIPCSERLPEPVAPSQRREWFITSNQHGCVTLTCYEFESSPFKEGWQTDMTILAWMPLPEPWKGARMKDHADAD